MDRWPLQEETPELPGASCDGVRIGVSSWSASLTSLTSLSDRSPIRVRSGSSSSYVVSASTKTGRSLNHSALPSSRGGSAAG